MLRFTLALIVLALPTTAQADDGPANDGKCYKDLDHDGWRINQQVSTPDNWCEAALGEAVKSSPLDCNDGQYNVHAGQWTFFTVPFGSGGGSFDYDCDHDEEPMFTVETLFVCGTTDGWLDYYPDCGETADYAAGWYTDGSGCHPYEVTEYTMGCR